MMTAEATLPMGAMCVRHPLKEALSLRLEEEPMTDSDRYDHVRRRGEAYLKSSTV